MTGDPRLTRREFLGGAVAVGAVGAVGAIGAAGTLAGQGRSYAATTPRGLAPSGAKGLGPGGTLLAPDSLPHPHLPPGTDTLPEIDHVVVLMMENHSFDDHLGMLGRGDGLTLGPDGQPVNYNPDPAGGYLRSFHNPNTVGYAGVGVSQSWDSSHISWDHGTNLGFVKACNPSAMGYWTGEDLPFYHSMTKLFPIGDRYFCSVMAQTFPNRRFLMAATALGDVADGPLGRHKGPTQRHHLRTARGPRDQLAELLPRRPDQRPLLLPDYIANQAAATHRPVLHRCRGREPAGLLARRPRREFLRGDPRHPSVRPTRRTS